MHEFMDSDRRHSVGGDLSPYETRCLGISDTYKIRTNEKKKLKRQKETKESKRETHTDRETERKKSIGMMISEFIGSVKFFKRVYMSDGPF